jgi:hypothetical protein
MKFQAAKLLAIVVLGAGVMFGQASRTWVSGVGDDANPCSRTAPCKTFAGAISKTAAGGEIDALDPGGFGALTITKAITLDGGGGQVASVLVAGTNGIVVQAGANDVVIIRNLRINGIVGSGAGGINGVRFLSGKDLNIENCYIFGFTTNGLDIALNQATQASVHVYNSVFKQNNGVGIRATNATTPPVQVVIDHTDIALDTIGVEAASHSNIEISYSVISKGTTSGISSDSATDAAILGISHSQVIGNASGALASGLSIINTADTTYSYNSGTALNQSGTGKIFSFGTNRLHDNGANGSFTPITQQ